MTIVFIHKVGISPTMGGISRITHTLGETFEKMGHKVFYCGFEKKDDIVYSKNQFFLPKCGESYIESIKDFVVFCKDNKVDYIINQSSTYLPVLRFLSQLHTAPEFQAKIVTCYHNCIMTQAYNYAYQNEYYLKKRGLGILFDIERIWPMKKLLIELHKHRSHSLYKKSLEFSDAIVFLNEGQKNEFLEMCGIKEFPNSYIIPNCVNLIEDKIYSKENIVLWVGQFDNRIKRPDLMIKIWEKIANKAPNWKLIMLGDGSDFPAMKDYVSAHKIPNIELLGRTDSFPFYDRAKVVCVTSVHESFSLVTVEGMMHKSPVVLFDSFPMASNLVNDGVNGYLVKNFNHTSFEKNLLTLIKDEEIITSMGEEAYKSVLRFNTMEVGKAWIKTLNEI